MFYFNSTDAVTDLRAKGYTTDFQLFGNDLLLIQQERFVRPGDFSILEYHRFYKQGVQKITVIGIKLLGSNVRGILLKYNTGFRVKMPPVIVKKLAELAAHIV